MKTSPFVLVCTFLGVMIHLAQPADAAAKPSGADPADRIASATCQITFDSSGHSTVVVTQSIGSKKLDDSVVQYVRSIWGRPNAARSKSFSISNLCRIVTPHGKSEVVVFTPRPPYPLQARALGQQGAGVVKATFDKSGRAVTVEMAQSTGSKILDENTVNYARANWRSSGGEKVPVTCPVDYRLM